MKIPLLDLKAQYETIRGDIDGAIARVVESQHFILGPEVDGLERELAAYTGITHAVGVSSGTDAILLALMALGISPGDEIVTTPYTFIATCSCIARLGARAVMVDIDPLSYAITADRVAAAVTSKTKAIMPVHLFGRMSELAIADVARSRSIPLIEDAAQSLGAKIDGVSAGAAGTAGTYSFFPSKNLGGFGDGGMVVTQDAELASRLRLIRNQGQQPKYFSIAVGGNFRLDALQAAILRAKLPHLDGWSDARRRNANNYRRLFEAAPLRVAQGVRGDADVALPVDLANGHHVYNQFVIRARDRDALRAYLAEQGIGSEVYYPQPMHLQVCFASWGYRVGDFPEAERAAAETLAIPVYPELTFAMQEQVVETIARFYAARPA